MGQALQKRRKHQICNSIGHKMTSEVIKQPTCTEDGLTRHYCTRRGCKYEYTTNAPVRLGHVSDSPKEYQPVTLNCATDGKTCTASRKWTQPCTRCGTNLNSGTDTATATVTSAVKTAATCTTKGTTTYTHRFSESWAPAQHTKDVQDIPKNASNHTQSKIKATTSTNPARGANVCWIYPCCHTVADSTHTSVNGGTATAHTVCSDCGYVISTTHTAINGGTADVHTKCSCGYVISTTHSYTSTTTPANCQNYSSTKYTCSCGYSYTTTGNTYGDHVWQQGATGSTGYCTLCGYTCSHDNADYVSYQNGWHDLNCPECGYTQYSQCTSKYSCTEQDGETFYWNCLSPTQHSFECAFCDYTITEDHTGFSTGECTKCGLDCPHNSGYYYGEQYPYEVNQWGCSEAEHEYYCSVCNKYLGREFCWIWGNITDNGDGTHTCTCSLCGNSYTESHYDECDGTCACGYQIGGSGGDTGGGSGGSGGVCTYDHSPASSNMFVTVAGGVHTRSECVECGYVVLCGGSIDWFYWGCPEFGGTCQLCGATYTDPYAC